MTTSLHAAVDAALALLVKLREERRDQEQAWALFQELRARYSDHWMNMVWEQETYDNTFHYDILIGAEGGTYSLSYCADEAVPWPIRGLQRVNESLVVRVNDEPVRISQVITSLDHAWDALHIGRHLINMALIELEVRNRRIEVSDEELAAALEDFQRRKRLFTVGQVEQWMNEHGTTQVQLEFHLRNEVARDKLRRQIAAGREEAYFHNHRAELERIQVARLYVADQAEAVRLYERLRAEPGLFLDVAQSRFLDDGRDSSVFVTLERRELDPEQAALLFATEPGQVARPVPSGKGYELVRVLRFLPARFDETVRKQITGLLFDEWLADMRSKAHVEWFWGASEAAELPAVSL